MMLGFALVLGRWGATAMGRWLAVLALGLVFASAPGCATAYRGQSVEELVEEVPAVEDPRFLQTAAYLLGPGFLEGNRLAGLHNGDGFFPPMLEAIRAAQKTITFETYIYWGGQAGAAFADALAERARAGVCVHLIIDWIGSRKVDSRHLKTMREAGVEVEKFNHFAWWNPLDWLCLPRINHRDHRKLLVVDGKVGFTGGAGVGDVWLGNAETTQVWRDSMFRIEGPVVAQIQAVFAGNWSRLTGRTLAGEAYFPSLSPVGEARAQVLADSPGDSAESVRLLYLLSAAGARKSFRLGMSYFIPDALTRRALVEARQRGVEVELLLPGHHMDVPVTRYASWSRWKDLLEAGVRIYEYQPTMFHAKYLVVDDIWASVGSANFDSRSFRLNDEANVNVYSREFAAEVRRLFEADKAVAKEITYDDWKRRSLCKRLLGFVLVPFRPLM